MTKAEFEDKWHTKIVRNVGTHWNLPVGEYWVSDALLNYDVENITIFAIMGVTGNFTIKLSSEQLPWLDEEFIIQGM